MTFIEKMKMQAKQDIKTIVLPESKDIRTLEATEIVLKEGFANIILIGNPQEINELAEKNNINLNGAQIVNPATSADFSKYANDLYELRKNKGMTIEKADKIVRDPLYFGTMMVKLDDADGMVSGAIHSTADTVRPALQIIKTKPGISRTSGVFLMNRENTDHRLMFADCAINIEPNAQELAEIAINTAETAKVFGIDPKVAMLSFSTKGSAKSPKVDRVVQATNIAKEMRPDLAIDGELQFDAAFVPATAAIKAPDSDVAGHANVFVFPGLQAGNIGYKIAQRLGMFEAIGPILQGLNKPVNDLSRGASAEDIYNLAIITAAQALNN